MSKSILCSLGIHKYRSSGRTKKRDGSRGSYTVVRCQRQGCGAHKYK